MENSFHRTFSPVIKVIAWAGLYFPGSDALYLRHGALIRSLTRIMLAGSLINLILEAVNEFLFMAKSKAEGLTDLFTVLGLGAVSPSYIFIIYTHCRSRHVKEIIDIWEKEMLNPPYPEDRKVEIANNRKTLARTVKIQIFCFIIPITMWSSRTIFTKKTVLPIIYTGDLSVSPTVELVTIFFGYFAYCVSTLWCASENIKLMLMKCILAELNHLYSAADKILTFSGNDIEPNNRSKELKEMEEKLRSWIIYHQTVLRFSEKVNNFMAPMILIQNVATVGFMFSIVFIITMGYIPIHNGLPSTAYVAFYYNVIYVANSLGDEIRMKSETILDTFNGKEYYLYPNKLVKNILFIQYVAKHRPITLKATWYKSLSRKSFGELTRKGYEIITFMRHFVKRNEI